MSQHTIGQSMQFDILRPTTAELNNIDTAVHIALPNQILDTSDIRPTRSLKYTVHNEAVRHSVVDTPPLSRKPTRSDVPNLSRITTLELAPPQLDRPLSSYEGADTLSPVHSIRTTNDLTLKPQHVKRISVVSQEHGQHSRTPSNRHKRLMSHRSFWRSNASEIEGTEPIELPKNVIHPHVYWLVWWESLILMNILYQAMIVPFTISFWPLYNDADNVAIIVTTILNTLTDIVFITDVFIRFRLAIIEHSVLITDLKQIRQQYLRTWFTLDFIAAIPIDLVQIPLNTIMPVLRINKLVRLVKTFSLFNKFESNTGNSATRAFVIRLIKLLFYTCLFSHIVACIKYHVMLNQISASDMYPDPTVDTLLNRTYFSRYLQALYWATGAITGRDDTDPPTTFTDTIYTVVIMVLGMLWFAYIVASLESFIDDSTVEHSHQNKLKYIAKFMKSYNIPLKTQEQVKAYYSYLWSSRLRYDSTVLVNALPVALKQDLYYELYGELLAQCELFQQTKLSTGLISLLASKLTVCTVIPNEVICSANTTGTCMWFIQHGEIEILVGQGKSIDTAKSIATLRTGDYFGEYSIFVSKYRTSTAKAVTYCTLLQLNAGDMLQALSLYNNAEQIVRSHVVEHRQRTKQQESNLLGLDTANNTDSQDTVKIQQRNAKLKRLIQVETDISKQNIVTKWTFSSNARWYQLFIGVYILATMYNTILIPVRFAFGLNDVYYIILDYIFDSIYIIDMLLQLRLRYIDKGVEVTDTKILRKRYIESWFILHILSILPFDLLMIIPSIGITSVVRINRILRIVHINNLLLHRIKHHIHHEIISLGYFIFCVLLLSHWSACIYWSIAVYEGYAIDNYEWNPPNTLEYQTIIYKYLRAQYYSMSLLAGIGRHNFPPTDLDVLFTLLLMLTGVFLVSYIIGKVGYLVLNLNAAVQQQKNDLTYYTQHMHYNQISSGLFTRIQTYFTHKWTIQHGIDPNVALAQLPYALRADIMFYLCETLIKSVPKFKNLEDSFVRNLAAELTFLELPDNEYVFRQGFTGDCIYFVSSGLVELVVEKYDSHSNMDNTANNTTIECTETTLKILGTGSFFGEGAIFNGKRSTSARTKSNCQLLVLSNESFKKIVQLNVSFATVMSRLNTDRQAKVDVILGIDPTAPKSYDTHILNDGTIISDSPSNRHNTVKQRNPLRMTNRKSLEPQQRLQAARSMATKHEHSNGHILKIDTHNLHENLDDINILSPARNNMLHVVSPTPFTPNSTNRALFDNTAELNISAILEHGDDTITVLPQPVDMSIAAVVARAAAGNGTRTSILRKPTLKSNNSNTQLLSVNNNNTNICISVSTPNFTAHIEPLNESVIMEQPNTATDTSRTSVSNHNSHSSDNYTVS